MARALLDTNVLVSAVYSQSPLHAAARQIVHQGLHERGKYCIAPQILVEFAAVVSRPRVVAKPMEPDVFLKFVTTLFRSRNLGKLYPKRGTVMRALREGTSLKLTGPRWYGLFLAATMRDAGVQTLITDNLKDFTNIPWITAMHISDVPAT
ncbi:MAG: type II toxin-antitoxin system VapC family toxin [Gemmataceae bacterium]